MVTSRFCVYLSHLFVRFFEKMLDYVVTRLGYIAPKADRQQAKQSTERVEDDIVGLDSSEAKGELQQLDDETEAQSANGDYTKPHLHRHPFRQCVGECQSEGEKEEGVHEHHAPVLDLLERRYEGVERDEHDLALCRRRTGKRSVESRTNRCNEQERVDCAPELRSPPQLGDMPSQRSPQHDRQYHVESDIGEGLDVYVPEYHAKSFSVNPIDRHIAVL